MAIITISRGSYSRGRQVAEKLGQRLGYKVISREVLISTSAQFNIPEIKLKKYFRPIQASLPP
ncbi:MAG: cytidylate kinase family protein [Desulfovermiculus sp.]|nr:cytidylate kinase family protein [Desulfovermiculus sp.]